MDNSKFTYDMPSIRLITNINCYPVNMVYDTGSRIQNVAADSSLMPIAMEDDASNADKPTIVEKKNTFFP